MEQQAPQMSFATFFGSSTPTMNAESFGFSPLPITHDQGQERLFVFGAPQPVPSPAAAQAQAPTFTSMQVQDQNQLFAAVCRTGDDIFCDLHDTELAAANRVEEIIMDCDDEEFDEPCSSFANNPPSDDEDFCVVRVRGVQDKEDAKYAHISICSPMCGARLKNSRVEVTLYTSLGYLDKRLITYMGGKEVRHSPDRTAADYIVAVHWDYTSRVALPFSLKALYDFATK